MSSSCNRREFIKKGAKVALGATVSGSIISCASSSRTTLYIVPNTHGTVAGWLDDFDTERNYCLNNYLDHLDRVDSDPHYAFAYSEVPNLISFLQFAPSRLDDLKARIHQGRVELVNAFFVESAMNLSGGEAIVQLGVNGLRWYEKFFGLRPRYGWMIDVVGNHRQMPQIVAGLGLDALLFCRNNPAKKTVFWWVAPDGTRALTICNANSYAELPEIFTTQQPLASAGLKKIAKVIDWKKAHSPSQKTLLALGGSGDYSLAPLYKEYPSKLLDQWKESYPHTDIRFCTLSDYVKPLRSEIKSGNIKLEEYHGDTAYCFNAFWYDLPQIKKQFREMEYALEAAEMLSTAASLKGSQAYPSQQFHDCWMNLAVNMDRNALWGSAGGKVFRDPKSWDAEDRYASVRKITSSAIAGAMEPLAGKGESLAVFNPLNWERNDPVELSLPSGKRISGVRCEASLADSGRVICRVKLPASGVVSLPLETGSAERPRHVQLGERIVTAYYTAMVDEKTGALTSVKLKDTGRELLAGPANIVLAESVAGILSDPGDFMLPRPQRKILKTSSDYPVEVRAFEGALATTVSAKSSFYGSSKIERIVRFYYDFPRIDFETKLDLHADEVLITVDFPLIGAVAERTRGIPYGFAAIDPRHPFRPLPDYEVGESRRHGFSDAILPAVRWSNYQLAGNLGMALLAHGLTAHELNDSTVTLGLFNAHAKYNGWPNELMAGQGPHRFSYALVPHDGAWPEAGIPRRAWEFNGRVFLREGSQQGANLSFLETSENLIVGALRREKRQIELRVYEWKGVAGDAQVTFHLPHRNATLTNLMGEKPVALQGLGPAYRFSVRPQQIVTIRFDVDSEAPAPELTSQWLPLVPPEKQPDLSRRILLKGHPPFGPGSSSG